MWMMRILSAKIKRKQREYFVDTVELTEEVEPAVEFDSEMSELKHAMNNLDPQSRMCLSMSVIEGYTGDEISKICGINANTVRSLISRAKKKLRMAIEG
jgi:RNA polymerase sigma-70 factor (ECF subfamily)